MLKAQSINKRFVSHTLAHYQETDDVVDRLREEHLRSSNRSRVANITDFSVEVRNLENDSYFSRFLYRIPKFLEFLRILQFFDFFSTFFIVIRNHLSFDHGVHELVIVIRNTWS